MKLVKGDPGWEALFSDDEIYRFMLRRPVGDYGAFGARHSDRRDGRVLVSCGLNPSTADAFRNDQTVRKELGFAAHWGCVRYIKVNAYAWRGTYPDDMFRARLRGIDIVGFGDPGAGLSVGNDEAILSALRDVAVNGGIALAAWGTNIDPRRAAQVAVLADRAGVEWRCLGHTKNGSPKHSLYPSYDTPLETWP